MPGRFTHQRRIFGERVRSLEVNSRFGWPHGSESASVALAAGELVVQSPEAMEPLVPQGRDALASLAQLAKAPVDTQIRAPVDT